MSRTLFVSRVCLGHAKLRTIRATAPHDIGHLLDTNEEDNVSRMTMLQPGMPMFAAV